MSDLQTRQKLRVQIGQKLERLIEKNPELDAEDILEAYVLEAAKLLKSQSDTDRMYGALDLARWHSMEVENGAA